MRTPCVGCLHTHSRAPQSHGSGPWRRVAYLPYTNCYPNLLKSFPILLLKIGQPPNLPLSSKAKPNLWRSMWAISTRRCCESEHLETNTHWPISRKICGWASYGVLFKRSSHFHMGKLVPRRCSKWRWMRNAIWSAKKIRPRSQRTRRSPKGQKPQYQRYPECGALHGLPCRDKGLTLRVSHGYPNL